MDAPAAGKAIQAGKSFGTVESVKSVSDLYAPVSGTVTAVNSKLADAPELVNKDPYGDGWMVRIKLADRREVDGLLDAKAYQALVEAH